MSGSINGGLSYGRTVLDCVMHKRPSTRKIYRVILLVSESGIPLIEYCQVRGKKPRKTISFTDLWYADRKHDTNDKHAFSVYLVDRTITFLAPDETTMNDWLSKIRECHSNLYPELTQYDAIFEANLLDRGLGRTMNLQGPYRLALCKDSLDLVPLLTPAMIEQIQQQPQPFETNQARPTKQRFSKRHPWVTQKTIQLARKFIRRCGHTDSNFYIEAGRLSTVGQGDLWLGLNKKSTAKHLHELLMATQSEDTFLFTTSTTNTTTSAPRSRVESAGSHHKFELLPTSSCGDQMEDEDGGYLPMA